MFKLLTHLVVLLMKLIQLIEPTGINITTSSVNTNCSNTSNGSIFANANGGTPPYQFSLNSTFTWQNSNIFNNLSSGTYSVDVLDSDGCIFSSNTNVGIAPPYTANISSVDATCGGGDGLAYVTLQAPTSGISTLSYCDSRPMRSDYSNIELVHLVEILIVFIIIPQAYVTLFITTLICLQI